MIGTMRLDFNETLRMNRKKTMVPMKAAVTAPDILAKRLAAGNSHITRISPRAAHSVVPVVVGSTNRFWVSSCMMIPHIAIDAPARTSATVRGTRVMLNIQKPSSVKTSNCPTSSERTSSPTVMAAARKNMGVHSLRRR